MHGLAQRPYVQLRHVGGSRALAVAWADRSVPVKELVDVAQGLATSLPIDSVTISVVMRNRREDNVGRQNLTGGLRYGRGRLADVTRRTTRSCLVGTLSMASQQNAPQREILEEMGVFARLWRPDGLFLLTINERRASAVSIGVRAWRAWLNNRPMKSY